MCLKMVAETGVESVSETLQGKIPTQKNLAILCDATKLIFPLFQRLPEPALIILPACQK
jgi:hypothetical protein